MKHFLLALSLADDIDRSNYAAAEGQLGKTVLYGDVATFSRWQHIVAWVQSTAATHRKRLYVCGTSANAQQKWLNF